MEQVFVILRKDAGDNGIRYERFEVPVHAGMSILDALFYIQDHLDPSLSFRYACRGGNLRLLRANH